VASASLPELLATGFAAANVVRHSDISLLLLLVYRNTEASCCFELLFSRIQCRNKRCESNGGLRSSL
jgi:hypothetical protein